MERFQLQPAYILHQRPWRDSSGLIEAFSRPFGRIGLIARGARRSNSKLKAALQPFQPVLLSWTGRGDLATLTGAEATATPVRLTGSRLLCGFYVNELLIRLLHRHDPHPELFDDYARCLNSLGGGADEQAVLRLFEKRLLIGCGYGLNLAIDIDSGEPVHAERQYQYVLEQGPRESVDESEGLIVPGTSLLALEEDRLDDEQSLRDAKRLLRAAVDLYLGGKPLKTRQVSYSMQKNRTRDNG
ncbi:MAG TPA: DNA repair protein RecO [Gammaproteobacteria bacterium]|nr:DNA repair protein RecO [Gammaproteobacteria bacterium]